MKQTAKAPSNIAFIKYWGKVNEQLRLPLNSSISMNLSGAFTTTTVEFSSEYPKDEVQLVDGEFSRDEQDKVIAALDRIRQHANISARAKVVTKNSFPKGSGAASSASGFAALTVAGFAAAGVSLSESELTVFARIGSGSACRSIPDGFVVWEKGQNSDSSYAYSLYPYTYWDLRDVLVIVDSEMKKISSSAGMEQVTTSPALAARLAAIPQRMEAVKTALASKNLAALGEIIEEDCIDMHHVAQTQHPPVMYWNETTKILIDAVKHWRQSGLPVYFTIDAGPNVHLIYEGKDEAAVVAEVKKIVGIETVILNKPAPGTTLINEHLF